MSTTATRWHEIDCGHRVVGQGGKCEHLHGHRYRIHFTLEAALDDVGRVLDFGVIKNILCQWLEDNWDHRFLVWEDDSLLVAIFRAARNEPMKVLFDSFVLVPFNPTAENMAHHLYHVGNELLRTSHVKLVQITVEETSKCSATYRED